MPSRSRESGLSVLLYWSWTYCKDTVLSQSRPQNSDYLRKMLLMKPRELLQFLLLMRITSSKADACDAFDSELMVNPTSCCRVLNSVCVSPVNDAFVPHDPIATELKIYKEHVAIYEQHAKFELTECEQRMDDQMRMLIQNRNKMEEYLKKELHSFKLQLKSTMDNNKIIEETVTTLKQGFKQKESKFLTDFSNLKHLNDKLENKIHSQDQSIQTFHMMLNTTQVYNQKTKTALGAQNPCYPRQAKKAQPTLYDGDELLKPHHVPVMVPSSEEELKLAKATRNKLHVKINDSACVEKRVNITPPNYSKENFHGYFTL
ncbi:hypothetical protein Tco_0505742 [Tanacetum coccineum]